MMTARCGAACGTHSTAVIAQAYSGHAGIVGPNEATATATHVLTWKFPLLETRYQSMRYGASLLRPPTTGANLCALRC